MAYGWLIERFRQGKWQYCRSDSGQIEVYWLKACAQCRAREYDSETRLVKVEIIKSVVQD